MTLEIMQTVFGWCAVINFALLLLWFLSFVFAHDVMYRAHGKLFKLSVESFDTINYAGLAAYKLLIMVFNIAPYVAIQMAR